MNVSTGFNSGRVSLCCYQVLLLGFLLTVLKSSLAYDDNQSKGLIWIVVILPQHNTRSFISYFLHFQLHPTFLQGQHETFL